MRKMLGAKMNWYKKAQIVQYPDADKPEDVRGRWSVSETKTPFVYLLKYKDIPIDLFVITPDRNIKEIQTYGMNWIKLMDEEGMTSRMAPINMVVVNMVEELTGKNYRELIAETDRR